MNFKLNTNIIENALISNGLTNSTFAELMGVSREIVSQWLQGKKKPRNNKLLKIATILHLTFDEFVIKAEDTFVPQIAFRMANNIKPKDIHHKNAEETVYLLKKLVPYIPEAINKPLELKNPSIDDSYIHKIVSNIRKEIGVNNTDKLPFYKLISKFSALGTILIPVLWNKKDFKEEGIHIHLTESYTTWVYLNLDTKIYNFKFWMAHELAHIYATDLIGKENEIFADKFAQMLLFPPELAKEYYLKLKGINRIDIRVNTLKKIAKEYEISLITIVKAINSYCNKHSKEELDFGSYHGAAKNVEKRSPLVSSILFKTDKPAAGEYIDLIENTFRSPIIKTLKRYFKSSPSSVSFVQRIFRMSIMDAKAMLEELSVSK